MLQATYYSQNYARIIAASLVIGSYSAVASRVIHPRTNVFGGQPLASNPRRLKLIGVDTRKRLITGRFPYADTAYIELTQRGFHSVRVRAPI